MVIGTLCGNIMPGLSRAEAILARIKEHPFGPPPETCLRCDDPHDFTDDFNIHWQDRGSRLAGEPSELVGGICADCMEELLDEWGYDPE